MAVYIPRRTSLGWAKEATPGTYEAPDFWTPHQSMGLKNTPDFAVDNSALGNVEENHFAQMVYSKAEGPIEGIVYDDLVGLHLLAMFGSVSTGDNADSNAAVKDHTFSVSQTNTRPSLTIVEKNANLDVAYTYATMRSLSFTAEAKNFLKYSADFISKASASSGGTTPSLTVGNRFIPGGITMKIASTVAGLSGGTAIPLRSFTINFENGAEEDPDALGQTGLNAAYSKTFSSSIQIEGLNRDTTLRALHAAGTSSAVGIYMTNAGVTIGAAAAPTLNFLFEPGYFNPWSDSTDLDALSTQTTTFNSLYSTSQSKSLTAVLTNVTASY